jgi:hypothetical protein
MIAAALSGFLAAALVASVGWALGSLLPLPKEAKR